MPKYNFLGLSSPRALSRSEMASCIPRPLELEDFLPLSPDLHPHVFDFPSDEFEVWHFWPRGWNGRLERKGNEEFSR
jgi:hypothetical protein